MNPSLSCNLCKVDSNWSAAQSEIKCNNCQFESIINFIILIQVITLK